MRLKVAIWIGCLLLSNISMATAQATEAQAEEGAVTEGQTPTETITNGDDTATNVTTTTTPKPLDAPVGSRRQFSFASGVEGMTMELDFEQQANNSLKMHCRITNSAIAAMEKFCMDSKKPKIYMIQNHTDCSDLSSLETVKGQEIAHSLSPNDEVYEQVKDFTWKDLEGNCFAMLQEKSTSRAGADASSIDTDIKGCDVLLTTTTTTTEASATAASTETQTTEETGETIIDDSAIVVQDTNRIGARRSGRLILTPFNANTRIFNTITLASFTILSTGTVFTAPTIVNAAPSPVVVSFGSFGGYTYNPWSTLPYLQLPGWTVSTVYAIVTGLFGLYSFVLLGSYIPGVSDFFNTISTVVGGASATRKLSRFVTYSNDRLFDSLTNFVHNSVNRFARRNTYQRPHYTRRTDLNYDYYEYADDQSYAENQYFRK